MAHSNENPTPKPNKIPFLYIFLYSKLKERAFDREYLSTDIVLETIGKILYHVPGNRARHIVLKELEEDYGLIRKINRMRYFITESKAEREAIKKLNSKRAEDLDQVITYINTLPPKQSPLDQKSKCKIICEDKSIYKILPSNCIRKLENLNTWILGS